MKKYIVCILYAIFLHAADDQQIKDVSSLAEACMDVMVEYKLDVGPLPPLVAYPLRCIYALRSAIECDEHALFKPPTEQERLFWPQGMQTGEPKSKTTIALYNALSNDWVMGQCKDRFSERLLCRVAHMIAQSQCYTATQKYALLAKMPAMGASFKAIADTDTDASFAYHYFGLDMEQIRDEVIHLELALGYYYRQKGYKTPSPLHFVVQTEAFHIARQLCEYIDPNIQDDDGKTPLHGAHEAGMIYILYEKGADINAQDRFGNTPLYYCIERIEPNGSLQQPSVIAAITLLSLGADLNAKNLFKRTPAHLLKQKSKEIQENIAMRGIMTFSH